MAIEQNSSILRYVRAIFGEGVAAELTDRQLLERFTSRALGGAAAEQAFAVLVARHGPMVLRVCRAAFGDAHDAQDAFQALFHFVALGDLRLVHFVKRGSNRLNFQHAVGNSFAFHIG